MGKKLIKQISEFVVLYIDDRTGLALIENGKTGNTHGCHPSICASGSVIGMVRNGHWKANCRPVRLDNTIYNTSVCSVQDDLDEIARQHCRCGGNHESKLS